MSMAPKTDFGPALRFGALASLGLLVALGLWLGLTRINGAVIAPGRVEAAGTPREVQSLDGGQVASINVSEGQKVAAGEVLLELDSRVGQLRREVARNRLTAALAKRARLEAEASGRAAIAVPDAPAEIEPEALRLHLDGQREVLETRRGARAGRKSQIEEKRAQLESRIDGVDARITALQSQLASLEPEMEKLGRLVARQLMADARLQEKRRQIADLEGRLASARAERAELRTGLRDTALKIAQLDRDMREEVASELDKTRAEIEQYRLEIARLDSELARARIRAPVDGIIHDMRITGQGAVLAPDRTAMTIVPVGSGVEFRLRVRPAEIDTVFAGQTARLSFPAFDRTSTPEIIGKVVGISADVIADQRSGESYYRIDVAVSDEQLARIGGQDALIPGMPVQAFLQTPARSVLSYLARPLTGRLSRAFREG